MFAKVKCYGLCGIDGFEVTVETDIRSGLPGTDLVGLPDASIKEAKERVKSAIKNSGYSYQGHITVNLAPADIKKEGPVFDLAMALAILGASEQISPFSAADGTVFIGELSLDGQLRPVRGALPLLISAAAKGSTRFVVPAGNAAEAAFIKGAEIYALHSLGDFRSAGGIFRRALPRVFGSFG